MLIRRCVWHRQVRGYAVIHGIASWRGRSIAFTDGVCGRCAQRVRDEWQLAKPRHSLRTPWFSPAGLQWAAAVLLVTVSMTGGAVLSAQPIKNLGRAAGVSARLPVATAQLAPTEERIVPVSRAAAAGPRFAATPRARAKVTGAPRGVVVASYAPLARLELAQALGDRESFVRTARVATQWWRPGQIGTLEAELARSTIDRASARLLLAMADGPGHAGALLQTP